MYLNTTIYKNEFAGSCIEFCGVSIPKETSYCEVWSSNFKDQGEDFNIFRFFDINGVLLEQTRISGY